MQVGHSYSDECFILTQLNGLFFFPLNSENMIVSAPHWGGNYKTLRRMERERQAGLVNV